MFESLGIRRSNSFPLWSHLQLIFFFLQMYVHNIITIIRVCYYITLKNLLFILFIRGVTEVGGRGRVLRPPRAAKGLETCDLCAHSR
jgi:hypothetical protein